MPLGISGTGNMREDIVKATQIARSWQGEASGMTKINATIKDQGVMVPPFVIQKCHGIAFLFFLRAGFTFSGELGTGFVISKLNRGTPQQRWSAPTAITAGGMGWGALIGVQKVSHVVVLNNNMSLKNFSSNAKVNFGADVGVAAGPVGRAADARVQAGDRGVAATYSYSYAQGLYAGIGLDGMVVTQNPTMNSNFYGSKQSPKALLNGSAGLDAWQFCPELAELYKTLDSVFNDPLGPGVAVPASSSRGSRASGDVDELFPSFSSGRGATRRPSVGVDLMDGRDARRRDSATDVDDGRARRRQDPYDDLYDAGRDYNGTSYRDYDSRRDDYGRYDDRRPRDDRDYDRPYRRDSDYDEYNNAYRVADEDDYARDDDRRRDGRRGYGW